MLLFSPMKLSKNIYAIYVYVIYLICVHIYHGSKRYEEEETNRKEKGKKQWGVDMFKYVVYLNK